MDLASALATLTDTLLDTSGGAGVSVIYRRGSETVEIPVVFGQHRGSAEVSPGAVIDAERIDFIIRAANLMLGGERVLPQDGDEIDVTIGGTLVRYSVAPSEGDPCFRACDPLGTALRVKAQRQATEMNLEQPDLTP